MRKAHQCVKFQVIVSAVDTLIHSVTFISAIYFWQKDNLAVERRLDFERNAFLSGWVQKAEKSPVLTLNKSSSQVETLFFFFLEECLIYIFDYLLSQWLCLKMLVEFKSLVLDTISFPVL